MSRAGSSISQNSRAIAALGERIERETAEIRSSWTKQPTRTCDVFETPPPLDSNEWRAGYNAFLLGTERLLSESDDWLTGWDDAQERTLAPTGKEFYL